MNAQTQPITLTGKQLLRVYRKRFQKWLSQTATPEEALVELLADAAKEVAAQRELTQMALAEAAKYRHPETGAGLIKNTEERLARYNDEGQRDANELAELQTMEKPNTAQKRRMAELADELQKDSANVDNAQSSLVGYQANYEKWSALYRKRKAKLDKMHADYEALRQAGPLWIQQIKDAEKAKAEQARDFQNELGLATDEAAQLADTLRLQAEQTTREADAGEYLDKELAGEPTLDEELAARDAQAATNITIQGWMSKAKGS